MATVICVDGLGGHPKTTFGGLMEALKEHDVVLVDTEFVYEHEDRVQFVLDAYRECGDKDVFLIGQSAGGSAVRVAAERLEKMGKHLSGVVLLSPAMPRGIPFMTTTLVDVMLPRWKELLLGLTIFSTEEEYRALVTPLPLASEYAVTNRRPISGVEGRMLAFLPPKFVGYSFPTLHIFGGKDRWIAPRAQRKLARKLAQRSKVTLHKVSKAGHLVLASNEKTEIIEMIREWIVSHSSS